tara:strand:- start:246 stop:1268 length:1023 start_codon:yes stop_codon:yes gene_type:complete
LFLTSSPWLCADERIEGLSQDALQQAFHVLKRDYIRPEALSYDELNKAAFEGLLRRLSYGAQLVARHHSEEEKGTEGRFLGETITKDVGYVRFASYREDEVELLDQALIQFEDAGAETLILDLRVPAPEAQFKAAARILDRFVPTNTLLFQIQHPGETRPELFFSQVSSTRWRGEKLLLLIDPETPNVGEIIAASIDSNRDCFMIGATTKGLTVQYHYIPLSEDTMLRYAVAEVLLADGTSLFKQGVQPDFDVAPDIESKRKVFAASESGAIQGYLFETARPRINEAALVHETDPELDYHLTRSRGETTKFDTVPLQDLTLQRSLDLLTTLDQLDDEESE